MPAGEHGRVSEMSDATGPETRGEVVTIRPKGPVIMAAVMFVIAAVAVVYAFVVDAGVGVTVLGPMILLAALVWLLLANPHVEVSDSWVRVVNPLRTYEVPLSALRDVATKWALTLATDDGTVVAWSATSPSGRGAMTGRDDKQRRTDRTSVPRSAIRPDGTISPSDLSGTDSGDAATAIRTRWESARTSGALDDRSGEPVRTHLNLASIGVVVVGIVMTVVSVLV